MPQLTVPLTAGSPIIEVMVSVSVPRMRWLNEKGASVPPAQHVRAILDTGASHSCVDPLILNRLGLEADGTTKIYTSTTGGVPLITGIYAVGFIVPNGKLDPFLIPSLKASATALSRNHGIQVIFGRDVFSRCVVTYDGPAATITLAY